jgi:hypothetical protein
MDSCPDPAYPHPEDLRMNSANKKHLQYPYGSLAQPSRAVDQTLGNSQQGQKQDGPVPGGHYGGMKKTELCWYISPETWLSV